MVKKTITYTDYDGVERTEDFYFNLSKSELIKMEYGTEGGLTKILKKIADSKDTTEIMRYFDEILSKAYGEKSLDGKRFIKSKELYEAFAQTNAYDILFMELFSDTDKMTSFIKGIVPDIPDSQNVLPMQ